MTHHHIDDTELLAGIIRSAVWAVGVAVAVGNRRLLLVLGFGLAALTSAVFALTNAGIAVSAQLFHLTSYASPVTPGLIVASLIMTTRSPMIGRSWRL